MSLQWTFIATFLYFEIFLVVLLLLPFISATRWQTIFRSRLLTSFRSHANIYFNIFIVILLVLFFDSIRDVRRFSETQEDGIDLRNNPQAETLLHMKLFRAQRNFYIAGFALFLFLVLRRLVVLISQTATLSAEVEAAMQQAKSASAAASELLNKSEGSSVDKDSDEVNEIKEKYNKSKEELQRVQTNLEAMKKQAESTNNEYDRLSKEHAELQQKYDKLQGAGGDKKDD